MRNIFPKVGDIIVFGISNIVKSIYPKVTPNKVYIVVHIDQNQGFSKKYTLAAAEKLTRISKQKIINFAKSLTIQMNIFSKGPKN